MAIILSGRPVAAALKEQIKQRISNLRKVDLEPTLGIIRVGKNPDDAAYEKNLVRQCAELGIVLRQHHLSADVAQDTLMGLLDTLNRDPDINGIMLFMPLPPHLDEGEIRAAVNPEKDIDGINVGARRFNPATPRAVIELLKYYEVPLSGSDALIINSSDVVGKPLAMMMLSEMSTITVGHVKTRDLQEKAKRSEIVISAVGRAKLFDEGFFSEESVVIDVGINQDEGGRLCGDIDYEAVKEKVRAITPVPGGVGSVTTTVLMGQVVEACAMQHRFVQ